ncbi:MAG: hypothetical protein V7607_2562 [Solirubrobacteraceae bacterium]
MFEYLSAAVIDVGAVLASAMPLAQVLSAVEDVVTAQVAVGPAAPAALALGPHLIAGRGRGIRTVRDYLDALARVESQVADRAELVNRIRLASRPGLFSELYYPHAERLSTPGWYWAGGVDNDELSRAWDVLATTGYLDVAPTVGAPRELAAVYPLWLALDSIDVNAYYKTLLVGEKDPPALRSPADYVTWAGGMARAWSEWNRGRRLTHAATPVAEWPAAETAALDPEPLRRAIARAVPVEDVRGFADAGVLTAVAEADKARPLSVIIGDYYAEAPQVVAQPHVTERQQRFLEASTAFAALAGAGKLTAPDLQVVSRAVLPAALRRLSRSRSEREAEAATPWGQAAVQLIADELAAWLAGMAGPLGGWPAAGFGARTVGPQGTTTPLYGGWDLQYDDSDGALRFAGAVRPADPGHHLEHLVADLRTLGFTAAATGTTEFDARVALAVREFQIEASQARVNAVRAGTRAATDTWRRYLGRIHGIVDAETRRMLQLWLDLPRVAGEPAEMLSETGVSEIRNGLRVVACASTPGKTPVASPVVADDIWGPLGTPSATTGIDHFDFMTTGRRHWAVDQLQRWGAPVAAEAPTLGDFGGPPVPPTDVDVVPLGRYGTPGPDVYDIGGGETYETDHWSSTLLTLARFHEHPRASVPVRDEDWPIVYGMTYPETSGFADVPNAYDKALLSFGWCHWTMVVPGGDGELGALLSWYRERDPAGFDADFARWGVAAQLWPATRDAPGKHTAPILLYGVRAAGIASPFVALRPPAADGYLRHTWMRSWRTIFRVGQALRRSDGLHAAMREFAVRRIWEVLNWPWTGTVSFAAGASLGDLFTSQQAVVALMRWHINKPSRLFGAGPAFAVQLLLNDAVNKADAAYRAVVPIGAANIDASTLDDPALSGAVGFQKSLIARLTAPGAGQDTVDAPGAIAALLPGGAKLSADPGSYPGPAAVGTYP